MRILKIIMFGLSLSIVGTLGLVILEFVIGIPRGHVESGHAVGLSAVVAGLLDATIFNPIVWLLIIISFGVAYRLTKPKERQKAETKKSL
jgi:hypothetical protein